MNHLITGGAGFIGRWLVARLLERPGDRIVSLDDYSNSRPENLAEFRGAPSLKVREGSITDRAVLDKLWKEDGPFDTVYHLAASIRVQDSIDDPRTTFMNDVVGTFEVLEQCRRQYFTENGIPSGAPFHLDQLRAKLVSKRPRVVFMSTCMVYATADGGGGISERHPVRASSPYSASKISGEQLSLSYHHAYGMPVKVIRPFNTYGPFQKRNMEGGVVAIFIDRDLRLEPLLVKGDGRQTRDLLYVADAARFVAESGLTAKGDGQVLNAGLGTDVTINDLARMIADPSLGGRGSEVRHVAHDHPQAEIQKLLCDSAKAKELLGWSPEVTLEEGIRRTRDWIIQAGGVQ